MTGALSVGGLHDFIRAWQQLRELGIPTDRIRLVVNQARSGLFAGDPTTQIRAALARYLGIEPAAFIPYDRAAIDAALMAGQSLAEARPGSPAQQALAALAAAILDPRHAHQPHPGRRRRSLSPAGRTAAPGGREA